MPWYLRWLNIGKEQALILLIAIAKKFYQRVYADVRSLVQLAQTKPELKDGWAKARWVMAELVKRYDEAEEWKWLLNLLREIAVVEVKGKAEKLSTKLKKKLKLPGWLR